MKVFEESRNVGEHDNIAKNALVWGKSKIFGGWVRVGKFGGGKT
jgi:hypothetical protein